MNARREMISFWVGLGPSVVGERERETGSKFFVFKPPISLFFSCYLLFTTYYVSYLHYMLFFQFLLIFNSWLCLFFVSSQAFTTKTENVAHKNRYIYKIIRTIQTLISRLGFNMHFAWLKFRCSRSECSQQTYFIIHAASKVSAYPSWSWSKDDAQGIWPKVTLLIFTHHTGQHLIKTSQNASANFRSC